MLATTAKRCHGAKRDGGSCSMTAAARVGMVRTGLLLSPHQLRRVCRERLGPASRPSSPAEHPLGDRAKLQRQLPV